MLLLLKVFHDIGDERLVSQDSITRGRFLGRGAFGAVYAGTMTGKVCMSDVGSAVTVSLTWLTFHYNCTMAVTSVVTCAVCVCS